MDVCGRARNMGDVVATVKLVREFIRAGRDQDYGRRLAELSQSRYSALVAGGMKPRDAQRSVGNGMYDRKQSQRDLARLSDEENKMLWQAAKEMAFPPNYQREAQAWIGRRGGPMPKRLQGRVEAPWLIVPSSQPVIAEPAEKHGQG
jgi:hypothetical protein